MMTSKEIILKDQYRLLEREYKRYESGEITRDEYLKRIKPIDQTIDRMEMATLLETPVSRGSSSLHSPKPGS